MASRPDLTDESIRLQVLLERVKAGENEKLDEFLREVDRLLRAKLVGELTASQRERIEARIAEVEKALTALQDRNTKEFLARMDDLAELAADTETKSLAAALGGFDVSTPATHIVRTAVLTSPLSVRGVGGGLLLDRLLEKHNEATRDRIAGAIRRGYFEGQTTEQIVRTLRGTKAANYADGIIGETRRNARTVAHTAVQHIANTARMETMKANADILDGYRWVSTLDNRTSEICQSLDGQKFAVGEGPVPPAHPNCRSTIVPVTKTWKELGIDLPEIAPSERASADGPVPASLTYFEWLKTQPASFVEEALGPTRAELFLKGGLSADEFAKLQLGRNFQPLTIEEMREKAPKVFERAGV